MLHVSCDLCGKDLAPGNTHNRYVVKIEVFAAHDPAELTEADLDEDQMEAVSQLLRDIESGLAEEEPASDYKHFRYDLCPDCQKKFVRDPLAKEANQKFDFSEN